MSCGRDVDHEEIERAVGMLDEYLGAVDEPRVLRFLRSARVLIADGRVSTDSRLEVATKTCQALKDFHASPTPRMLRVLERVAELNEAEAARVERG